MGVGAGEDGAENGDLPRVPLVETRRHVGGRQQAHRQSRGLRLEQRARLDENKGLRGGGLGLVLNDSSRIARDVGGRQEGLPLPLTHTGSALECPRPKTESKNLSKTIPA